MLRGYIGQIGEKALRNSFLGYCRTVQFDHAFFKDAANCLFLRTFFWQNIRFFCVLHRRNNRLFRNGCGRFTNPLFNPRLQFSSISFRERCVLHICWISAPSQRDRSDVKFHQGICIFFADGKVRQCITELAEPWHGFPVPEFENPIPVQIGNTSQHVIWHQFKKTALDYPRFMQKPIHLLKCFTELYRRRALYCRKAPFSEYCKHVSFTVHCKATLSFLCTACIQYYNKIIQITQSRQKIRRVELWNFLRIATVCTQ